MPTYCWSASEITKRKQQVANATFFKLQESSGGSVKNNPQTGDTADSKLLDIVQGSRTTYYRSQHGHLESDVPCSCVSDVVEINRMEGFVPGNILFMVTGSFYYTDDNSNLVSLNPDTSFRWYFKGEGFANGTAEPFIDINGNIYYATRSYIYSIDPMGNIRWKQPISESVVGIYGTSGMLYISTQLGKIYRYDYNGNLYNYVIVDTDSQLNGPVRIGPNGKLYSLLYKENSILGLGRFVFSLNYIILDTDLNNIQQISTYELIGRPVSQIYKNIYPVFYGNDIYILSDSSTLYSYNITSNIQNWLLAPLLNDNDRKVSPVIINNYIYIIGTDKIYKIDLNGTIILPLLVIVGEINQVGYDMDYIYTYNLNNKLIAVRLDNLNVTEGFTNQSIALSCILSADKLRLYTYINDTTVIEVNKTTLQPL
jgi:hypothetical protein